jgi:hypothetical protein
MRTNSRAAPSHVRNHHAIHAPGWSCRRHVHIRVAIQINQADPAEISPRGRDSGESDAAIPADNQRKCTAFHGNLNARPQIIQGRNKRGNISRAGMFLIRLGNLRDTIAMVGNLKPGGLQPLNNARGAQRSGRALVPGGESRSARRRPNQGNLLRLTDNLYGQRSLLSGQLTSETTAMQTLRQPSADNSPVPRIDAN